MRGIDKSISIGGRTKDTYNSTADTLLANIAYTGTWRDCTEFASLCVDIITDQDSATDGLQIQFSDDRSTVRHKHVFSIKANSPNGHHYVFSLTDTYYRMVYTNGATGQSTFYLSSMLSRYVKDKVHAHSIEHVIDSDHPADVTRAVIIGKNPAGDYVNVQTTTTGNLKISLEELESGISVNANSQLRVTPFSSTGEEFNVDANTNTLVGLDFQHNQIHKGLAFTYSELVVLGAGGTRDLLIVTPNSTAKKAHFIFDTFANDEINIKFYEDTTTSADGTGVTEVNRDRSSATTADTVITHTPTVTTPGTLLEEYQLGGSTGLKSGATNPIQRPEYILDVSQSKYMLRVTATNANTDTSIRFEWYEHTIV